MKNKNVLVLLTTLLTLANANAGGIESGGGDMPSPEQRSAWFLGDRMIRSCVEIDPAFGVGAPEAIAAIQEAFQAWINYISVKKIDRPSTIAPFAKRIEVAAPCKGGEDLQFFLGTSNSDVDEAKGRYHKPIAFAERQNYDAKERWGQGFIWISRSFSYSDYFPDWSESPQLHLILNHEFGHVFGCDHVDGTIMTENIGQVIAYGSGYINRPLPAIDGRRVLFSADTDVLEFSPSQNFRTDTPEFINLFEKLVGRKAVGSIHAKARLFGYDSNPQHDLGFTVMLTDQFGKTNISIVIESSNSNKKPDGNMASREARIFRRAWLDNNGDMNETKLESVAGLFSVPINAPSGRQFLVDVEYNMDIGPLVIKVVDGLKRVTLFEAAGAPKNVEP